MRTLLLADDSITVQRVIALIFAKEQVQVVAVGDGRQALASIAARKPDIILAGTSLPHLDGYDLSMQIRNSPELRQTPVLLLSGAFELVDQARLKTSGADGVIEKPVEPTAVIRRVKELLGLKSDDTPAPSGRLVTSAGGPQDKKLPSPAVTVTRPTPSSWEQLRDQSGLEADAPSVQSPSSRSADYLDTLDAAFDSLDDQLSGGTPAAQPSGAAASARGSARSEDETGHAIFEVDDEWFAGKDIQARADRHQQELAAEMGVHEIELPERAESPEAAAMIAEPEARTVPSLEEQLTAATPEIPATHIEAEPSEITQPEPEFTPAPPQHAAPQGRGVADDFAALLAYEQGEPHPAFAEDAPSPVEAAASGMPVAPVITEEMLDSIAERVAARLNSTLGEQWRELMAVTVRDSVRSVVSETSERLVREEIDRIKNNKA